MLSSSQIDFAAANLSESMKPSVTATTLQPSVMMEHLWPSAVSSQHSTSSLCMPQQLHQPVPQFSASQVGVGTMATSSTQALYSNAARHLTHHGFATHTGMDHFHHAPSFSSLATGESPFGQPATLHSMLGGVGSASHSSTTFYSPYISNSGPHQWTPSTVTASNGGGGGGGRVATLPSHPSSTSSSMSTLNPFSALGFHHCPAASVGGGGGVFQSPTASFSQLSVTASGNVGARSAGGCTGNQLFDLSNHVVSRRLSLSLAGGAGSAMAAGLSLPVKMAGDCGLNHTPAQLPTRLNVAYIPLESPKRDHSSGGTAKSTKSDRHSHLSSHHHQQHLQQQEHKQPEVACQVCHQAASNGLHFGARTCAACAAFFRRSISDQKRYACKRSQRCVIRPGEVQGYRKMCRSCRMKRCMEIGMLPENVQNKRHKRELYYASLASLDASMAGDGGVVQQPPQLSDQSMTSVHEQQVPTPAAHYEFQQQHPPPTGLRIPDALSNLSLIHQLQQQQQQPPTNNA